MNLIDGLRDIRDRETRLRIARKVEEILLGALAKRWTLDAAVEVAVIRVFIEAQSRPMPNHPPEFIWP